MDTQPGHGALVRCSACHTIYEQPADAPGDVDRAACPHCGEPVWIAVDVPVPEPAPRPTE
jgi:rRNA maturation endonuclease Nob1